MSGLYIHIPFCSQFCAYCDFYSLRAPERMPELLQALREEMRLRRDNIAPPDTLYIGGGTPSLYKPEALGLLIQEAGKLWDSGFKEVTIELNPEDVTRDYCLELLAFGVNRLSIGIQSFKDEHLRFMNRRHDAGQGVRAVEAAQYAGFQNISIDLIFGFPGLADREWQENVEQALSLSPAHISAYQLGIEPGTPFYRAYRRGLLQPMDQGEAAAQYAYLQESMAMAGFLQYEISNFARAGFRALHNSAYWKGIPYLGLGPSAHSFYGNVRYANVRHLERYLEGVRSARLAVKEERLTPRKQYNEFVMVRLRTVEGIPRTMMSSEKFGQKIYDHFEAAAERLLQEGRLVEQEGYIKIPPEKWFVSDGIIMELIR